MKKIVLIFAVVLALSSLTSCTTAGGKPTEFGKFMNPDSTHTEPFIGQTERDFRANSLPPMYKVNETRNSLGVIRQYIYLRKGMDYYAYARNGVIDSIQKRRHVY